MPYSERWEKGPSRKQDHPDYLGPLQPVRRSHVAVVRGLDIGARLRLRMPPTHRQDLKNLDARCRCGHLCFIHASYDLTYALDEEAYERDRTLPGGCYYQGCACTKPEEDPTLLLTGPPKKRPKQSPPEPPSTPQAKHRLKVWKSWE